MFRCNFKTRSGYGDRRGRCEHNLVPRVLSLPPSREDTGNEVDANSEFSAALTTSLDDLIHKSLKDEQTECIRRIISLEEAVLPVHPTGFGKSVITGGPHYVFAIKYKYLLACKTNYRDLRPRPHYAG